MLVELELIELNSRSMSAIMLDYNCSILSHVVFMVVLLIRQIIRSHLEVHFCPETNILSLPSESVAHEGSHLFRQVC